MLVWLARQVARQSARWTLWTPVALGGGSALYFALPREPQAWVAGIGAAFVLALLTAAARRRLNPAAAAVMVLLAWPVGGFAAAKLRAENVADGVWRVRWAQELRGRRPWTWGPDLR
jgi:competence protein ComEC